MRIRRSGPLLALVLTLALGLSVRAAPSTHTAGPVPLTAPAGSSPLAHLPVSFEPNHGQVDHRVAFLAHLPDGTAFLTRSGLVLTLSKAPPRPAPSRNLPLSRRMPATQPSVRQAAIHLAFQGANPHPVILGQEQLPGRVNYFIGNDPHTWHTNIPTYARVLDRSLYPGIDLAYQGSSGALEYDWIVRPRAQVPQIRTQVTGATLHPVTGGVMLQTAVGSIRLADPVTYQRIGGRQQRIASWYRVEGRSLALQLGPYDHHRTLIVDPGIVYSTYLGGNSVGYGIAVDAAGDVYVTGSAGPGFPTKNAVQSRYGGGVDTFVTELAAVTSANPEPTPVRTAPPTPSRTRPVTPTATVRAHPGGAAGGSWTAVAPLPAPVQNLAAVAGRNGVVYAIGGRADSGDEAPVNTLSAYAPSTNRWQSVARMPVGFIWPAASLGTDGHIYVMGGCGLDCGSENEVEVYNPATNSWACSTGVTAPGCTSRSLSPMPTGRYAAAAVTSRGGRIYVMGGETYSVTGNHSVIQKVNVMEAYNPSTNTWACSAGDSSPGCTTHDLAPLPGAESDMAAVLGPDGRIYVMGGYNSGVHIARVEVHDPHRNTWANVAPLPYAVHDLAAVTGCGGFIYALGGWTDTSNPFYPRFYNRVERYDPTTNAWTTVTPMPVKLTRLAAVSLPNGRIYAIGGYDPDVGVSATVEMYVPGSAAPITTPSAPPTPTLRPSTAAATPAPTALAGPIHATSRFGQPVGVAIDHVGNVFVADYATRRVTKLSPRGIELQSWSVHPPRGRTFEAPNTLAVDRSDTVYATDDQNNVLKYDARGRLLARWRPTDVGAYPDLEGIAVGGSGNIFAANANYPNNIVKLTPHGDLLADLRVRIRPGHALYPHWIAVGADGTIYATVGEWPSSLGSGPLSVVALSANGTLKARWTISGNKGDTLAGIAVGGRGNIFVVDYDAGAIVKLSPDGQQLARWTGNGGVRLYLPYGIAVDARGNLYVADSGHHRLVKRSSSGRVLAVWK